MYDTYIGDGVYASTDGLGAIILDLRAQDNSENTISQIVLESATFEALIQFRAMVLSEKPEDQNQS